MLKLCSKSTIVLLLSFIFFWKHIFSKRQIARHDNHRLKSRKARNFPKGIRLSTLSRRRPLLLQASLRSAKSSTHMLLTTNAQSFGEFELTKITGCLTTDTDKLKAFSERIHGFKLRFGRRRAAHTCYLLLMHRASENLNLRKLQGV